MTWKILGRPSRPSDPDDDGAEAFPAPSPGSELYSEFINEQLKLEDARKTSVEQRGIAVISLSGVLVTLLLSTANGRAESSIPRSLLLPALACLAVAAALGLFTTTPRAYGQVDDPYLDQILTDYWDEPEIVATRRIGAMQIAMLKFAKRATTTKARLLQGAVLTELLGIGLLAAGAATGMLSS